jgi:hypothetical protein
VPATLAVIFVLMSSDGLWSTAPAAPSGSVDDALQSLGTAMRRNALTSAPPVLPCGSQPIPLSRAAASKRQSWPATSAGLR